MIVNSNNVFDENIISQIADCKFFRCTREHLIELFNISNSVHVDKWAWEKFEQLIEYNLPIIGLSKNDDLIGFVTYLACLEEARILNIAVLKEFQNKGYGKKLLIEALKDAKNNNLRYAMIDVRVNNLKAVSLYTKLGFRILCMRKNYYDTDINQLEDSYFMQLELD